MSDDMNKIPSFTIDHVRMKRGVFVARKDQVGDNVLTTFDIRMKEPNREPVLNIAAIHTIEHLAATYLRNHDRWKDETIYFGPMGCRTGNYLILKGDLESKEIVGLLKGMFQWIVDFGEEIPGAAAKDCGNYLDHNLGIAQWESRKFLDEVLENPKPENLEYPA